jgi:hypothetical protein
LVKRAGFGRKLVLAETPNQKTRAITVILENLEIFAQKGWAMSRNMPGLRLGGRERPFAAKLVDGTPMAMKLSTMAKAFIAALQKRVAISVVHEFSALQALCQMVPFQEGTSIV